MGERDKFAWDSGFAQGYAAGQLAMRERAAAIALEMTWQANEYRDVRLGKRVNKIAGEITTAIRALEPEEPK